MYCALCVYIEEGSWHWALAGTRHQDRWHRAQALLDRLAFGSQLISIEREPWHTSGGLFLVIASISEYGQEKKYGQ
jgi:hypothetical protein